MDLPPRAMERPRPGPSHERSGTRRDRTRAPQRRRARECRETARALETRAARSPDEAADLVRAGGAGSPPEDHAREGRGPEDGSASASRTDADEAEPPRAASGRKGTNPDDDEEVKPPEPGA
jgi:hypothetical protein